MAKIVMATPKHYEQVHRVGDRHLADNLARLGHDVLYISGPFNVFRIRHLIQRGPVRAEYRDIFSSWIKGGIRKNDRLIEYCSMGLLPISNRLPFGRSRLALFRNVTLSFPSLTKYIHKKGFGRPDLLLISQLQFAELLERMDAGKKMLRLTDETVQFESVPAKMAMVEEWAVEKADDVLVTSRPLQHRLRNVRADVRYFPNAVDYDFYHSADRSVPDEYTRIPRPRAVYVGTIGYWLDVELVRFLAMKNPGVSFVLIGGSQIDLGRLRPIKNIYLPGPRPYEELPRYLWNADVGIIPFKKMPLVEAISPLKLYEYMACGLPVVSTRWKELEQIDSPALLAETQDEFARQLPRALTAGGDENLKSQCRAFAKANSWQDRVEEILRLAGLTS